MAHVESTFITTPTEPVGSIPRPPHLIERLSKIDSEDPSLALLYDAAIQDTIQRFEAACSPVVTDGEQRKYHNFLTYRGVPLRDEQRIILKWYGILTDIEWARP